MAELKTAAGMAGLECRGVRMSWEELTGWQLPVVLLFPGITSWWPIRATGSRRRISQNPDLRSSTGGDLCGQEELLEIWRGEALLLKPVPSFPRKECRESYSTGYCTIPEPGPRTRS